MKTHTVIDGNAFYEIDDECYAKLIKGKEKEGALHRKNAAVCQERNDKKPKKKADK